MTSELQLLVNGRHFRACPDVAVSPGGMTECLQPIPLPFSQQTTEDHLSKGSESWLYSENLSL